MRRTFYALVVVALWLAACSQADNSGDFTGTYELVTIDGHELPYTPTHEGGAPEVLSSTLILDADGTFRMSMTYGTASGNSMERDFSGTYTVDGAALRFVWEGAGVTSGTLEGDTVTIVNEGIPFAYQK